MNNKKGLLLFILMASVFVGGLDMGIVAPAFTTLTREFGAEPRWTVWALTLYSIVYAASMPIIGKLTDIVGRKKMLMGCLSLFGIGSALCALAPGLHIFLLGRAVQAIGGGGIFPVANAIIGDTFSPEKRGKALGMVGAMMGLSLVIGPNIGGFLVQYLSWHWIFWVNIPLIALILLFAIRLAETYQPVGKKIDFLGALLLLAFMNFLLAGISFINTSTPSSDARQHAVIYFGIALMALIAFLFQERRVEDPIVDFKLLFSRQIFFTNLIAITTGYVMTAAFFIPSYVEALLHMTPSMAGAMITPLAIGILVGTPLSGVLLDRMAAKNVIMLGSVIAFSGLLLLLYTGGLIALILSLIVTGFGLGFLMGAPLNYLIINSVKSHHRGSALGILSVFRILGISIGSTIAGVLIQNPLLARQQDVIGGYKDIYWYLLYMVTLAFLLALFLKSNKTGVKEEIAPQG